VARVHLKVDTGLGRNGIVPADLPAAAARGAALVAEGVLRVVGVWTHLAYADEPGHPTIAAQRVVLDDAVRTVEAAGIEVELRHAANSAATLTAPALHYDLVRPGIAVYGFSPVPQVATASSFGLRPAMTLQARLATVKRVEAGQGVSYAHRYVTAQATQLGVVPLGYADGIPRHASSSRESGEVGGPVYVGGPPSAGIGRESDGDGGRVVRVAGRVCMDQVVLDLGPYATEQAGDVVTLFGSTDGLAHSAAVPSAEDWAAAAGTISYEIVTRIGARIPRVLAGAHVLGERAAASVAGVAGPVPAASPRAGGAAAFVDAEQRRWS
jgi:alanine racemase